MATLLERAAEACAYQHELLAAADAHGDVEGTIGDALLGGRLLVLAADAGRGRLAHHIAASIGPPGDGIWPPVLAATADPEPLALLGCDYAAERPVARQVELLARAGDVVLVVAGAQPSADLVAATRSAAAEGIVVAGLGLPPCGIDADPAIVLPETPPERLVECQVLLGLALAAALAERLPATPPEGVQSPLVAFPCANCAGTLTVPRHLAGRQGVCPRCYNNTLLAPGHEGGGEQRRSLRFALRQCALQVALAPGDRPLVALPGPLGLENLGRGGLCFLATDCPVELQPGDRLVLELATPAFRDAIELEGAVHRVTREDGLHRVAVVFAAPPPAVAERLRILERNLVLRHLAQRPEP